ncbi:tripartite tricarboxylate transporter TctB family protein [Shinella sp.]|uniref:tripartite tricarboxylate transporter TctB family protein n=1 Tax=Shinella sp. TaxID=1870904 RepID=UPI003F6F9931
MPSASLKALAGNLVLLAAGTAFVSAALAGLDLGTARRLGPGAFPLLAGLGLVFFAVCSILADLVRPVAPEAADAPAVAAVSFGIAGFALLTPLAGVLPAAFVGAFVTTLAARGLGWRRRLIFSAATVPFVWLLFIQLLNLPVVALRGV